MGLGKKKLLSSDPHPEVPKWVSPASGWNPFFSSGAETSEPKSHNIPGAEVSFYKMRPKLGLAEIGAISRVGCSWLVWVLYLLCLCLEEPNMYLGGLCFGGSAQPSQRRA